MSTQSNQEADALVKIEKENPNSIIAGNMFSFGRREIAILIFSALNSEHISEQKESRFLFIITGNVLQMQSPMQRTIEL